MSLKSVNVRQCHSKMLAFRNTMYKRRYGLDIPHWTLSCA